MSETPITNVLAEARRLEGDYVNPLAAPNYVERTKFWGTHAPAVLAYVGELEHRIAELEVGDACFTPTQADVHLAVVKDRDRLAGEVDQAQEANAQLGLVALENRISAEQAEAEVTRLTARWEALKPSGELKAELLGEFKVRCFQPTEDEDGETPEQAYHLISWTTIKDILAKACAFAELEAQR